MEKTQKIAKNSKKIAKNSEKKTLYLCPCIQIQNHIFIDCFSRFGKKKHC